MTSGAVDLVFEVRFLWIVCAVSRLRRRNSRRPHALQRVRGPLPRQSEEAKRQKRNFVQHTPAPVGRLSGGALHAFPRRTVVVVAWPTSPYLFLTWPTRRLLLLGCIRYGGAFKDRQAHDSGRATALEGMKYPH